MFYRLDLLLVKFGLASGREKAKELIRSGKIIVNGDVALKPSDVFSENDEIISKANPPKYVSRGGFKLEKAIVSFDIDLKNKICADVGASTGGFSDCLLQNGAKKIYAIDVGHNQLHEKLRGNSQIINIEGLNAREIDENSIPEKVDFLCADLSFISIKLVLANLLKMLSAEGEIVVLIKPQFEAGKENIGKNGVVKSDRVHIQVLSKFIEFVKTIDINLCGLTFSPIVGGDGNVEYLAYLSKKIYNKTNYNVREIILSAKNNKFKEGD